MGRRSDHNREELEALIIDAGASLIAEVGLAGFAAREVARRIGYSVGTIHNVFGTSDHLVTAINTRTFGLWIDYLRQHLEDPTSTDRVAALIQAYFAFARAHTHLWTAIYDHRLSTDALTDSDHIARGALTDIVVIEVARELDRAPDALVVALSRSLIATVHGHCAFTISGAWELMGEAAPEAAALARVREAIDSAKTGAGHATARPPLAAA